MAKMGKAGASQFGRVYTATAFVYNHGMRPKHALKHHLLELVTCCGRPI